MTGQQNFFITMSAGLADSSDPTSAIASWGLCLPDCPYIEPEVSCLAPPPVPRFGIRNDSGTPILENYKSSWFVLEFIDNQDGSPNQTHYKISRATRDRLFQPWMEYQSDNLTETNLEFIATSQFDHFNDVYQIRTNASIEEYECPVGWHFENTKNVSHFVQCLNWTWVPDFNISVPCVRKFLCH